MRRRVALALKGSLRPPENDSAFLLDPHRRGVPGRERMRPFGEGEPVDMLVIGAGAGGATLAQRLARRGWRVLVLEAGPFWDPDEDWVSDEAGSHDLYWTEPRVIGGEDPVELGKNNCGRGVGGSMVHYAGYTPRFHPSDFEVRSRDGVAADWPITYQELKPHYERLERELPVAGQWWPWGDPHGYPHGPHPVAGGALRVWEGARRRAFEMRVGPVGIANGAFGNRPHCIYRGFCLQGCKVNAKASPLVTHVPDALEHGVEIRADCMVTQIELDERGRCRGVTYVHDGQRALPGRRRDRGRRLLDRDTATAAELDKQALPTRPRQQQRPGRPRRDGPGRPADGRTLRAGDAHVQGAAAGDQLRAVLRDRRATRVRAWVLDPDSRPAADRLGRARTRRRPLGAGPARVRARLQPLVHDRRALRAAAAAGEPRDLAEENDARGMPVARLDYSQCENDRANIAYAKQTIKRYLATPPRLRTCSTIDRYAHLVGGCAMSGSPETGVVDRDHRAWEIPNLFIADGSVMPTQGSANPALTIMALASRLAERLVRKKISG